MRQNVIGITIVYVVAGYLVGSILFASLLTKWIRGIDLTKDSKDGNPGTANAFMQGGFVCGVLSLVCDLGKGFLPVYSIQRSSFFLFERENDRSSDVLDVLCGITQTCRTGTAKDDEGDGTGRT